MKFLANLLKQESTKWILVLLSVPLTYWALALIKTFDSPDNPIFVLGIIFSIGMTLLYTFKIVSSKQVLKIYERVEINVLIFFISFFIAVLLAPFISWESVVGVDTKFWWVFVFSSFLYYLGKYFNLKAVSTGEISSVVLLHAFTPISIGFFALVILQELPNLWGALGVLIIMISIYILKAEKSDTNLLDPFRSLFRDKASIYMILAILFFGATTSFDKVGSQLASAFEWVFLSNIFLLIMSTPAFIAYVRKSKNKLKEIRAMYAVAVFAVFQLVFQMIAILHTLVVYVTAIKVSSIIFTIILGGLFFKEKDLAKKIPLSFAVVLGVLIISFLG